jgi:hypothetical protein
LAPTIAGQNPHEALVQRLQQVLKDGIIPSKRIMDEFCPSGKAEQVAMLRGILRTMATFYNDGVQKGWKLNPDLL